MKAFHQIPLLGRVVMMLLGSVPLLVGMCGAATSPRESFLAATQSAYEANFRNDVAGLRAAVTTFAGLSADPELGPQATYFAVWTEWMIASSQQQDGKKIQVLPRAQQS